MLDGSPSATPNRVAVLLCRRIRPDPLVAIHKSCSASSAKIAHPHPCADVPFTASIETKRTPSNRTSPVCVPSQRYPLSVCRTEKSVASGNPCCTCQIRCSACVSRRLESRACTRGLGHNAKMQIAAINGRQEEASNPAANRRGPHRRTGAAQRSHDTLSSSAAQSYVSAPAAIVPNHTFLI